VVTCLACNIKKITCCIGSPEVSPKKRKVRRAPTLKAKSDFPKVEVRNTARQVCGPHDLYSLLALGYSQQVLDELLVASENTSDLRRIAEVPRKDQWKLGKRQLKLEELRLKVELGVMGKEQAAAELEGLPELVRTKVENPAYQLVYERRAEAQEKLATERREEGSGSEQGREPEGETMRE